MNNHEFVTKLKDIANNYKTLYVMGCIGAPLKSSNKNYYCNNYKYNKRVDRTAKIKAAENGTFGFDCVCLIKSVLWGWNGDITKSYGGAKYQSNGVPDITADAMYNKCTNRSTDFTKIQIGEAVWTNGHIGVYIGDGLAVECTPSWKDCVQITAVGNIGAKTGYPTRKWKGHGKLPWLEYEVVVTKTIDELAKEVILGKWGVGVDRKKRLGELYQPVQQRVNEILRGQ